MRLKLILYLTLFFEKARALCKGLFMNLIGLKFSKKQGFRVGSHSVITLYRQQLLFQKKLLGHCQRWKADNRR